jgi:hypothetical protein
LDLPVFLFTLWSHHPLHLTLSIKFHPSTGGIKNKLLSDTQQVTVTVADVARWSCPTLEHTTISRAMEHCCFSPYEYLMGQKSTSNPAALVWNCAEVQRLPGTCGL